MIRPRIPRPKAASISLLPPAGGGPKGRMRATIAVLLALGAAPAAGAADLLQAYELARQSDPQLANAESTRLANREQSPQARAALLPQVNGTASLQRSDSDSSGGGETIDPADFQGEVSTESTSRQYTLNLQQSIYDHANWTRLRAGRARATQADFEYEAAADALMVRTAEAYFNVLTAIQTLASGRAQEAAVKRQFDQAEQRLEVGLAPITDVHEARAAYDNARANAILAQTALNDANEALAEITGEPLANLRGLAENYEPTLPTPQDEEAWVQQALELNPSIKAAEFAVEGADENIGTQRAGHYPRLTASASYGKSASWGDTTLNGAATPGPFPFNSENDGPTVGIQLEVPIFAGGAVQSRVRQAIYLRDATQDLLEQQRRAVNRQTRSAYDSVLAGISEIEARSAAQISAKSAYDASEAGLEVGTRTIVEVLITQQNLFAAQREYANARHNFLVNTLRLKQQTGTIALEDIQAVNALLTADAESALDKAAIEKMATPDLEALPETPEKQ